jgi:hypothetical protein
MAAKNCETRQKMCRGENSPKGDGWVVVPIRPEDRVAVCEFTGKIYRGYMGGGAEEE